MAIMLAPLYKICKWTVETYGGARLLKTFLWPNPQTIGQLVLLYHITVDDCISNLVFEKSVEVANPEFNKDIVRALFSHGFC
jgi:hypothetical protein